MRVVEIPLRLRSRMNAREHWGQRARRTRRERALAYMLTPRVPVPCVVRIIRIGKRRMDGDNLQDCAKAVRDGVAQKLGVDDGDPRVTWEYGQEIGKEYGVRIVIEAAQPAEAQSPAAGAGGYPQHDISSPVTRPCGPDDTGATDA